MFVVFLLEMKHPASFSSTGVCVVTSVVLVTLAEMKRVLEFSFVLKTGVVERIEKSII